MERSIIHLNVTDFAVAVECLLDRSLYQRPVVVATAAHSWRAVVHDMSEEAFQNGVRKGMLLKDARRLCREMIVKESQPKMYNKAMRGLLRQALPYSPLVEAGNNDGHLFVDVSGTARLFGSPPDIACRIRRNIRRHLGLDPIWTVATNKLVAKTASRLVKPTGAHIVKSGSEEKFIFPLPLSLLPGLSSRELGLLQEFNVHMAYEAANFSLSQLKIPFGKRARDIYCTVRGVDSTPVFSAAHPDPRIGIEHFFSPASHDWHYVLAALFKLAEKAGRKLRYRNKITSKVSVWLEYADRRQSIRQKTLSKGVYHDDALFSLAQSLLQKAWTRRISLRRLRLRCDRLTTPSPQVLLFPKEKKQSERRQNLSSALDRIRGKHGEGSIRHGRCLFC